MIIKPFSIFFSHAFRKNIFRALRAYSDLCQSGKKQSPIDISTAGAENIEKELLKFENHWEDSVKLCMSLVGNILQIKANSDCPLTVQGSLLCGKYNFDQLILKWGECDTNGTEHSLDGQRFGMEAQLVYFNSNFKCAADALNEQDGIAILTVFLRSSEDKNCDFEVIVGCLPALNKNKGAPVPLTKNVLPLFKDILSKEHFTYEGSLTVPPCCETIRWLVWKDTICIHKNQIGAFKELCGPDGKITQNYREDIQELNGRKIQLVKGKEC